MAPLGRSRNNSYTDATALAVSARSCDRRRRQRSSRRPRNRRKPRTRLPVSPRLPPPSPAPATPATPATPPAQPVRAKALAGIWHINMNLLHGRITRSRSRLLRAGSAPEYRLVLLYYCMPLLGDEHLVPDWDVHVISLAIQFAAVEALT